jgi:hypothetical protein
MLVLLQIILLLLNPYSLALSVLLNLPLTRSSEQGRWGYRSHCCDTSSELLTGYGHLQLRSLNNLCILTAIELTSVVQKPAKKKPSTPISLIATSLCYAIQPSPIAPVLQLRPQAVILDEQKCNVQQTAMTLRQAQGECLERQGHGSLRDAEKSQ